MSRDITFRESDMPFGVTPESFAFKVEELDFDNVTDTLYTNRQSEADRMKKHMLRLGYSVRITHTTTTVTTYTEDDEA